MNRGDGCSGMKENEVVVVSVCVERDRWGGERGASHGEKAPTGEGGNRGNPVGPRRGTAGNRVILIGRSGVQRQTV